MHRRKLRELGTSTTSFFEKLFVLHFEPQQCNCSEDRARRCTGSKKKRCCRASIQKATRVHTVKTHCRGGRHEQWFTLQPTLAPAMQNGVPFLKRFGIACTDSNVVANIQQIVLW